MDGKTLAEVAQTAGITPDQARYWASLCGGKPTRRGRIAYLTADLAARIVEMAPMINAGLTPKLIFYTVARKPEQAQVSQPTMALAGPSAPNNPDLAGQVEGMRKAMLEMTTAFRDEALAIRATVERQAEEIRNLRTALLPPPALPIQTRKIEPWKPEPGPDPAEEMPWWRVAWLSLVNPAKLRRWDSA